MRRMLAVPDFEREDRDWQPHQTEAFPSDHPAMYCLESARADYSPEIESKIFQGSNANRADTRRCLFV